MIALPRHRSPNVFVFCLVALFLIAEYALVVHATVHGLQDPDEICFVCEKADNFQNTLLATAIPETFSGFRGYRSPLYFKSWASSFQALFLSRAPPVSSRS